MFFAYWISQTIRFTVADFSSHEKQKRFSKNCSESARHLATPGFSELFDFAVCGGVFCALPYDQGLFMSFSFILLESIVVYLKSGFRLTFLLLSFNFFKSIVAYLKLGSRLTFLLTFSLALLLSFNSHLFTSRREEEGRKEGVDLFLKSNDPI